MDSDLFSIKNIMAYISVPFTFLLGLCGYHYKNICNRQEELDDSVTVLKVLTAEQNVHIAHLSQCMGRHDIKLDELTRKLETLITKL